MSISVVTVDAPRRRPAPSVRPTDPLPPLPPPPLSLLCAHGSRATPPRHTPPRRPAARTEVGWFVAVQAEADGGILSGAAIKDPDAKLEKVRGPTGVPDQEGTRAERRMKKRKGTRPKRSQFG